MHSGTEHKANPHEAPIGRYLTAIARPLSQESLNAYNMARDGSLRRKYKPPRRKKDRRKLRAFQRKETVMPKGTKVDKVYEAIVRETGDKGKAARIAQATTHQSLATGKPLSAHPKGGKK